MKIVDPSVTMMPEIGSNIRKWRIEQGMTQYELGERTGASRGAIQYWETAQREITVASLVKIANALCVPVKYLFPAQMGEDDIRLIPKTLSDYTTAELLQEIMRREKTNENS